jgi:hypothetical protein
MHAQHRFLRATAIVALAIASADQPTYAESTVIRDTRLANLDATPSLGRGFTPAISALHGVCYDKMPTTPASYDLSFTFEELEASTRTARTARAVEIDDFVREHTAQATTGKLHFHHLLAVLTVDSYYASLDESGAELSQTALKLLGGGDVAGFFTSCGTHFIRSVSRRSHFVTLFSYTSTQKTRDRTFELQLQREVRKFRGGGAATRAEKTRDGNFSEQVRSRNLRVVTRSIGLTARKNVHLLPFDLASYREGLKEAFLASQEPNAGRVVAMEVSPWLSNSRVAIAINLGSGRAEEQFERRRILSDNAEFYIELVGALQQMNTQIHRAEACRRLLDQEVMEGTAIASKHASAQVLSHRTGERMPLSRLVELVSDASIDRMRSIALGWRDGRDGQPGAQACMLELERTGLSTRYHNDIPACTWNRVSLPDVGVIDEYCPPNLATGAAAPKTSPVGAGS